MKPRERGNRLLMWNCDRWKVMPARPSRTAPGASALKSCVLEHASRISASTFRKVPAHGALHLSLASLCAQQGPIAVQENSRTPTCYLLTCLSFIKIFKTACAACSVHLCCDDTFYKAQAVQQMRQSVMKFSSKTAGGCQKVQSALNVRVQVRCRPYPAWQSAWGRHSPGRGPR